MADGIVKFVLEKLGDAAINQFLKLCGVGEQMETINRELDRIKAFLKDADCKNIGDERQRNWVKEVRNVAYDIEDLIDNALLIELPPKKTRKRETIKRMFTSPQILPALRKLGDDVNHILLRVQEISESRERYGIKNIGEDNGGYKDPRPAVVPDKNDPDVVGFDADINNIVNKLLDKSIPSRCVVSIVGTGGLGKTTLARKAYNCTRIKEQFPLRIWVTVSQKAELVGLVKKIAVQIQSPIELSGNENGEEYFLSMLYKSLEGKKYLLVLDDIWEDESWTRIKEALPHEENGSRVLMTTRSVDIAKGADPMCVPYQLQFLSEESSRELFLRKALPNPNMRYFDYLSDITKQAVRKCRGLPLALELLGGLLSKKPSNYHAWNGVLQKMNWYDEGSRCSQILAMSYDNLPYALKSCFMYFAAFPEDYGIEVNSLIRMWIAEELIPQEDNKTLEETAENFLMELVQRSMVQVSNVSLWSSIKHCHVHDILRDVAIQKAKDDSFFTVCSNPNEQNRLGGARRVAVHNHKFDGLMKSANPNLRSLLCFEFEPPNCSNHRLLKVLSHKKGVLQMHDTTELERFEGLTQLRYCELALEMSKYKQAKFESLIGGMKFLQTLDLSQGSYVDLPDCIWHVETLRHVILSWRTTGPPSRAVLRNLQTLVGVTNRESWEAELPNLLSLRDLDIEINKGFPWDIVVTFLGKLKHLISLSIKGFEIPSGIVDMRGFPFYQHLKTLRLLGILGNRNAFIDAVMFPLHLTDLTLVNFLLLDDPLPVLEKLHNLKRLVLFRPYTNQTMSCSAGGFGQLEYLKLGWLENWEEWEIENGAMTMLKKLTIDRCPVLQVPSGLQHLTALRELHWANSYPGDNVGPTKAQKIRSICKLVPTISIGERSKE